LNIHVDGACSNNGKEKSVGGWAFVIRFDDNKKEIHSADFAEITTNQRMELTAMIKALEEVKIRWPDLNVLVSVFSDSQYVVKGSNEWMLNWAKNGWRKSGNYGISSEIANLDLWKKVFELVTEIKPTVKWVKGHSGDKYNELCDTLATTAVSKKSDFYRVIRNAVKPEGN